MLNYLPSLLLVACVDVNGILCCTRCRFMGSDQKINLLRKIWKRNWKRWYVLDFLNLVF